jgi:hypothetical protein
MVFNLLTIRIAKNEFGAPVVSSNIVDCGNQCLVKTKTKQLTVGYL